jgi:hypothetical protein
LNIAAHGLDGGAKTRLVPSGGSQRWPSRPLLPERQIAAQNREPGARERLRQQDQERRLAIRPSGVRKHKPGAGRSR